MKKGKEKITDVSGRLLENGDQVFILDIPNPNLDTTHIISSLIMGKVVLAQDEDNILVEIEDNLFSCPGNKLSKIKLYDTSLKSFVSNIFLPFLNFRNGLEKK